jgi:hypothetical protein
LGLVFPCRPRARRPRLPAAVLLKFFCARDFQDDASIDMFCKYLRCCREPKSIIFTPGDGELPPD